MTTLTTTRKVKWTTVQCVPCVLAQLLANSAATDLWLCWPVLGQVFPAGTDSVFKIIRADNWIQISVHGLLQSTPNSIVHWIEVWAVWWPDRAKARWSWVRFAAETQLSTSPGVTECRPVETRTRCRIFDEYLGEGCCCSEREFRGSSVHLS